MAFSISNDVRVAFTGELIGGIEIACPMEKPENTPLLLLDELKLKFCDLSAVFILSRLF